MLMDEQVVRDVLAAAVAEAREKWLIKQVWFLTPWGQWRRGSVQHIGENDLIRRWPMGKQGGVAPTQKLFLSVADVAIHLGVCRQTVYNYIYYEGMPSIKVRGMRRVYLDSLHTWLKERERVLA
jgi:excisionase family DNA binding protein